MKNTEIILYLLTNFFLYGFIGWIIENVYSYLTKGDFQEDGFLFGPFKPMYGIAMTILIFFHEILGVGGFLLLFLYFIIPTLVEYMTGYLARRYFHKNYWDYSNLDYNYQGIICLSFSMAWLLLTFVGVKYFQPYVIKPILNVMSPSTYWAVILFSIILIGDFIITLRKAISIYELRTKE